MVLKFRVISSPSEPSPLDSPLTNFLLISFLSNTNEDQIHDVYGFLLSKTKLKDFF